MPTKRASKPALKKTKRVRSERRRAPRGSVKLLTAFRRPDENAPVRDGFVRALSLSAVGALVESPDPFRVGQNLALELLLDNNRLAQVTGRVTRVQKQGAFYRVGVEFIKVPTPIKRWINKQVGV